MKKSALQVNDGIQQPSSTDPSSVERFLKSRKKEENSKVYYIEGIRKSNISILSKAITLLESSLPGHQEIARDIVEGLLPYSGKSLRIGITGVPGVGKSTFIEALGKYLIQNKKRKLAILAIDPSSSKSKGSILGDKTRMEFLSAHPHAYIRPSPSAGTLGGVALKTRETIILCEAAGFDTIFVETVGVGQSETMVHSMVDFFLLLMLAGAGDELQGIKRGIMEMADALVITKADGDNVKRADRAKAEYTNALHLFPPGESGWITRAMTCSAYKEMGIAEVWDTILEYLAMAEKSGYFQSRRSVQLKDWMNEAIYNTFRERFLHDERVRRELVTLETLVMEGKVNPERVFNELIQKYLKG
ncbi:MAG: methylmalonyl Co-A mutase-associated GTPase MeaB [Bacteroidales bacterium]|nr:methylmalonyl Co-A mutase-associated GTPase MeaB [Bacteroidales bacterium]